MTKNHFVCPPSFRRLVGLLTVAFISTACAESEPAKPAPEAQHPDASKWENLFEADLSNAEGAEHWTQEKGELFAKHHSTLWTKKSYGDFVLDLEFKVAKESNSGVFLRSGNTRKVLEALEIQVHEKKDGSKYGMVGAIYDALPPAEKVEKPVGEWNHFTITCKGPKLQLIFNGKLVLDADLDNWPEAGKNPDGTKNKFPKALKDFSRNGPIGFQGLHGKAQAPVWYRNVKIKELK